MLQFLSDEEAYPAVRTLRDVLAPGSHLALSHVAAEGMRRDRSDAAAEVYRQSTVPTGALRERRRIMEFFDGFTLVPPGLVWVSQWRPGPAVATEPSDHAEDIAILGGVGQLST
jgi:hypothetical protein